MSVKPILFSADMVRAILDGRKTVTRRAIKPQPNCNASRDCECAFWDHGKVSENCDIDCLWIDDIKSPYQPGDILYVRETWCKDKSGRILFKANYSDMEQFYCNGKEIDIKWHPSIHMPKEAARIWLKVTDVRVYRLQQMSIPDIRHEGLQGTDFQILKNYVKLWDFTIKKKDLPLYGWDANPWVWIIKFERTEKPDEN